ncbi:unnamed protein product, partial [Polarella glacialis]
SSTSFFGGEVFSSPVMWPAADGTVRIAIGCRDNYLHCLCLERLHRSPCTDESERAHSERHWGIAAGVSCCFCFLLLFLSGLLQLLGCWSVTHGEIGSRVLRQQHC